MIQGIITTASPMSETDLSKRIYSAQCLGNVEPIEYMVPYPNLRALVEGQNIKYGEKMVYADLKLTSNTIFQRIQQTANWLVCRGIQPKDRVMMRDLGFPDAEILAFGIWTLGAALVLVGDGDYEGAGRAANPALIVSSKTDFSMSMKQQPETFEPSFKPLLNHEALVFWNKGKGIRLSHYNLLVNANGIQHGLNLYEDQTYYVGLEPTSTAWVVLQAMLPLYTGATHTALNPDVKLGLPGQYEDADYIIDFNWKKLKDNDPSHLYVQPENTAFLAINKEPVHLTAFKGGEKPNQVEGHAVMMGYLNDEENEKVFRDGWLLI